MKTVELVKQIKRVRWMLYKAEAMGNIRLAKQYTMAIFHLQRTLEDQVIIEYKVAA